MPKKSSSKASPPQPDSSLDESREPAGRKWKKSISESTAPDEPAYDQERSRLTQIMQTIGTADGDAELVAVMIKSLNAPEEYLEAVRHLHASGRHEEALEVAEHGVERFRNHTGLTEILVDEYLRLGRKREALDAAWHLFSAAPDMEAFAFLKKSATACRVWKSWKQKAIELLEERSEQQAEKSPDTDAQRTDPSSLLVEIFLADGDDEAAWDAAATYGCGDDVWLRLAAARAGRNPEDALAIYRAQIERATRSVSWRAYERVIEMLRLMEPILRREGCADEFTAEVEALRQTWDGRRKNLVWMLDQAFGWGERGS